MDNNVQLNQWYSKVFVNGLGEISNLGYIKEEDLPSHTHTFEEINYNNIGIKNALKDFFVSPEFNSIEFRFNDSETFPTLEADIKIDNTTIKKNDFGELYIPDIILPDYDIDNIKEQLASYIDDKLLNLNYDINILEESPISINKINNNYIIGLKLDNFTLKINDLGELYVDIENMNGSGEDNICGTHYHSSSQITDFDNAVISLIRDNITFELSDLENIIDGSSIIINKDGKLSAIIDGSINKHTHTLSEITDFNNDWTVEPVLKKLKPFLDLFGGQPLNTNYIDFNTDSIGYALEKLDFNLKSTDDSVKEAFLELEKVKNSCGLNVLEPLSRFQVLGNKIEVIERNTMSFKEAYILDSVYLNLPSFSFLEDHFTINAYIDNILVESIAIDDVLDYGQDLVKINNFIIEKYGSTNNFYLNIKFSLSQSDLSDGTHKAYFTAINDTEEYKTPDKFFTTIKNGQIQFEEESESSDSFLIYTGDKFEHAYLINKSTDNVQIKKTFKLMPSTFLPKNITNFNYSNNSLEFNIYDINTKKVEYNDFTSKKELQINYKYSLALYDTNQIIKDKLFIEKNEKLLNYFTNQNEMENFYIKEDSLEIPESVLMGTTIGFYVLLNSNATNISKKLEYNYSLLSKYITNPKENINISLVYTDEADNVLLTYTDIDFGTTINNIKRIYLGYIPKPINISKEYVNIQFKHYSVINSINLIDVIDSINCFQVF